MSRDDVRIVERLDQREPAVGCEPRADLVPVLGLAVVKHDLGAEGAGVFDFEAGRVSGHDDHGRGPGFAGGERDALRVVAG